MFLGYPSINPKIKIDELRYFGPNIENHWYSSMSDVELINLINYLIDESKKLMKECNKYHFPFIEVENIAFQSSQIITMLFGK